MNDQEILNAALMSIPSRSEKNEHAVLISTFVQAGTLFKRLSSVDNQIIYGRRGTGKTHTLQFLAAQQTLPTQLATYTDLSSLGSATSVYSDQSLPLAHRATTLLRDLLVAIHEEIRRSVSQNAEALSLHTVSPLLSELLDQINDVEIVGETELGTQQEDRQKDSEKQNNNLQFSGNNVTGAIAEEFASEVENKLTTSVKQKGVARYHLKFGGVNSALRTLVDYSGPRFSDS